MSLNHLITRKEELHLLDESMNAQEAIDFLEKYQLRCAPVLDETTNLFRGNVYRFHIYQHFFHHPDVPLTSLPVTRFLKNATRVVKVSSALIQLFFSISDLPYIAVLDDSNTFIGIIDHDRMLEDVSKNLSLGNVGYILSFTTEDGQWSLQRLVRGVRRHTEPSSFTVNCNSEKLLHVHLFLPQSLDPIDLSILVRYLEKRVSDLEVHDLT